MQRLFKSKKRGRADFVEGQGCPFRMDYTYGRLAGPQGRLTGIIEKLFLKISLALRTLCAVTFEAYVL
jgi:hypothetical protein